MVRLAERCGLPRLTGALVRFTGGVNGAGAFTAAKVLTLVAGIVAGADCIDDMDRLRHGGMGRLFGGVRAPSTLGSFLRGFTHGHVHQLLAVARRFLSELAAHTPLLPGAAELAHVDLDDTLRRTYGYAKQGARLRLHQGQGPQRVGGDAVHAAVRPGHHRYPAAPGSHRLGAGSGVVRRRGDSHRPRPAPAGC